MEESKSFMKLRELKKDDAHLMLEWMHDDSVTYDLKTDFASKTIEDCKEFISNSISETDINYAITDENDEYLGTVSLKHMNDGNAEFAITIRKKAMGTGVSAQAMREIINLGFERYGLNSIYWCVSPENKRAVRFYDKNGFIRDDACIELLRGWYTPEEVSNYIWYMLKR